jgi:formylglycine-generating enzyme required for sulfatase activity
VYTVPPFSHTFTSTPSDVKVVLSYPFFDAGVKPQDQPTTGGIAYKMVGIPGGTFDMEDASGIQSVNVSSFSIGETEVTQGLWKAVWGSNYTPSLSGNPRNWVYGLGDTYPAYYISWYDAIAFCNKLSALENKTPVYVISGISDWSTFAYSSIPAGDNVDWNAVSLNPTADGYRLPTEAEWEYAARGGEDYLYSGSNEIGDVAWYSGNNETYGSKAVKTQDPNSYGLYDMSGNVFEWCNDVYNNYSYCGRLENPMQDVGLYGSSRVGRGGSWGNGATDCRVSYRSNGYPYNRSNAIGFRVVLAP